MQYHNVLTEIDQNHSDFILTRVAVNKRKLPDTSILTKMDDGHIFDTSTIFVEQGMDNSKDTTDNFDITETLGFVIAQTHFQLKKQLTDYFKHHGYVITTDQWSILALLYNEDSMVQTEIAARLKKDHASMTRTLDILEKKNLLRRVSEQGDRRSYRIVLSEKGQSTAEELIRLVAQAKSRYPISEDEKKQLKSLLNKILK